MFYSSTSVNSQTLPGSTHFPYTTLFRSTRLAAFPGRAPLPIPALESARRAAYPWGRPAPRSAGDTCPPARSEEHTSELQSHSDLVCRLLLEKKKNEMSLRYWQDHHNVNC